MKSEVREFFKKAIAVATSVWFDGRNGEPHRRMAGYYREIPLFSIALRLDITSLKEQILNAIAAKQQDFIKKTKGMSKSKLYEYLTDGKNRNILDVMKVETGIPMIDDLGLKAKFWKSYFHNGKHYAEARKAGDFSYAVSVSNYFSDYDCDYEHAVANGQEWIIFEDKKDGKLYLEHRIFPEFHNKEEKLSRSKCRAAYLKEVKAQLDAALKEGWNPSTFLDSSKGYTASGTAIFTKELDKQAA